MREDLETKISSATTLLDVLMILKTVTMLDTHVATLAFATGDGTWEDGHGILRCKPFPLDANQSEYIIEAYYFKQQSHFQEGDIVVILFMDRNFINNLKVTDKKPRITKDLNTHSLKYGVILETK